MNNILNEFNFKSIKQLILMFPNEQSCIDFLEKLLWNGNPTSPFDINSKVYNCKNNRYKCYNTGKYFTVKNGTIFQNSKVSLQDWFIALWLFSTHKGGISSLQLQRELNLTQKTTWFMLQKIRNCTSFENKHSLYNEVEIDETYIGGKNKNRHLNKKFNHSQGRSIIDKVPVLGMIERNGKVVAHVVQTTTTKDLLPIILKTINKVVYHKLCKLKSYSENLS